METDEIDLLQRDMLASEYVDGQWVRPAHPDPWAWVTYEPGIGWLWCALWSRGVSPTYKQAREDAEASLRITLERSAERMRERSKMLREVLSPLLITGKDGQAK
jgi:hypothetical protein